MTGVTVVVSTLPGVTDDVPAIIALVVADTVGVDVVLPTEELVVVSPPTGIVGSVSDDVSEVPP